MDHDRIVHDEIRRAMSERRQQEAAAKQALYGGQEGWFAECSRRKAADGDYQLARVIVRLIRKGGEAGSLRCRVADRPLLSADPAVEAFWKSVAAAGPEAWQEEKRRVKRVEEMALDSDDLDVRLLALDAYAVRSLMDTYRAWGQMLLDAGAG